ncbi:phosphatase PAP2 family protein [Nonomuraea soli]|uniref:Undecaprenyl-diphosphatase n=1 Tax=Nonomuraea soli TaxID=1032476 RepID=A0A7W0CQY1_9ACTN|nr:phosphatase PAP2 family protein [Nonomuraea soli]MBA2895701.1 undecaprenyl-diphosphatase [Nonomuraea soli]
MRPRWILAYGLGLAAAGAALTVLMLGGPPLQGFDEAWNQAMLGTRNDAFTAVSHVLNLAGGPGSLVIMLALLAWWIPTGRRWGALLLFATTLATTVVAQGVKHLVLRERPADPMVTVDTGSFPSGHVVTTVTFCLVIVAVLVSTRLRAGLIATAIVTVLMIWDRTYVSAHWFTDTIGSVLLGGGTTLLLWWAFAPLLEKDNLRRLAKKETKVLT